MKGSLNIDNRRKELETSRIDAEWRAERAEAIRTAQLNILTNNQRIREERDQSSKEFQEEMDKKREDLKRFKGKQRWYI